LSWPRAERPARGGEVGARAADEPWF